MYILGISAFYHDSAAALIKDGEVSAAAQEERFSRKKHDHEFPGKASEYCLKQAGIKAKDLDAVVFYEKPFVKFERILETYLAVAPRGLLSFLKSMPLWLKKKLWIKEILSSGLSFDGKILFTEHHESHAASAYYPSPFEHAAILTIDGVGEWATNTIAMGNGERIDIIKEIEFPHSLGLLYSAFTYFTGFKVNSGEYKLMGLAPYGEPVYRKKILDELVDLKQDGSYRLNQDYFDYCGGLKMTGGKFEKLFGGHPRKPESPITAREMNLAKSIQDVTEEIMLRQARFARRVTGSANLCMAGGVALNCVGNGRILKEGIFDNIWIQPAAGDAGGSLGAALAAYYMHFKNSRPHSTGSDRQKGSYLGPAFADEQIQGFLERSGAPARRMTKQDLLHETARLIKEGNVIGWFQGRMEFGPRALGARSIIGDARSEEMQSKMNLKIKFRESFRPFAPSVLAESYREYFDLDEESPYMLLVAPVKKEIRIDPDETTKNASGLDKLNLKRSIIPAVTHVDYTARIQTVNKRDNPIYHDLIEEFKKLTGCPVIVNTSFNVRGEPIVCSPSDAYTCFMRTEMDYLIMGSFILSKADQPDWKEKEDWREIFELD
ncbi:MAG: carbamoyltransferase [Deltaproteobacteria bacterium]|nr:carbamoyltransferase [Deltaproteobacteria bacterium]